MNWSDYEAIWKRQPLPRGAAADLAELEQTFDAKRRKLAATLLVRDSLELLACLVVILTYARYWQQVGAAGWPMGLAIGLILFVAASFVRERLRSRRNRLAPDATLLAKVDADIAELRHQCTLIRRVWVWYLAPCAGAMGLHCWVITRRAPAWSPVREPWFLLGVVGFLIAVIGLAWLINRRALRLRLEPRLVELEKLRADLVGRNDASPRGNAPDR